LDFAVLCGFGSYNFAYTRVSLEGSLQLSLNHLVDSSAGMRLGKGRALESPSHVIAVEAFPFDVGKNVTVAPIIATSMELHLAARRRMLSATATGTATLAANSGTIAELNLEQEWSADQTSMGLISPTINPALVRELDLIVFGLPVVRQRQPRMGPSRL
jgi:hypothetical protein